jgi:DNA-3-methyladenine glycosylase I
MTPKPEYDQEATMRAHEAWYSSEVWGKRVRDDDALFEIMSLQVFQAGLTWRMILARRDAFRKAFYGWNIEAVADMGPEIVELLLQDSAIIRNRRKIEACIENARIIQEIQRRHGSFCGWYYDWLEEAALSGLQRTLRATFKFMGPEIARMWLMASGRISGGD